MNEQTARALFTSLRRLADTQKSGRPYILPDGCVSRLDLYERRLLDAITRNHGPSPHRDGYPTTTLGNGLPTGVAELTSVEAAADANIFGRPTIDPLDQHVRAAFHHLDQAVAAVTSLITRLNAIDDLRQIARHSNPGGTCLACGRHVEGTADDRLRRGMCTACYHAWRRAGCPELVYTDQGYITWEGRAA